MENRLEKELGRLCREYAACSVEVERRDEARKVKNALENVCGRARQRQDISDPALLIALLDAYEVTRDEVMLQEVLDVVSRNLDRLAVSAESVKLLAYCYYYVEEEECAERARRMLEELRKMGRGEEELADAKTILKELM